MRNINSNLGLCNGVRAVVVRITTRVLDVLIISGKCAGERFYLPRIPMSSEANALPFRLVRRQFPVKLAWGMSINKAQGQSLVRVGVLLEEAVFAHGQLYVALSRAGSFDAVRVVVRDTAKQGYRDGTTRTANIVYRELLSMDIGTTEHYESSNAGPREIQAQPDEDVELPVQSSSTGPSQAQLLEERHADAVMAALGRFSKGSDSYAAEVAASIDGRSAHTDLVQ